MTTTHFTQYDPDTGRILAVGWTATSVFEEMQLQPGTHYLAAESRLAVDYVLDGQIVERPVLAGFDKTSIAADGIDEAIMVLPEPMTVIIDGVGHALSGSVELSADMPATYVIEIDHFPYLPFRTEIAAT
jgi:hypothetical protein